MNAEDSIFGTPLVAAARGGHTEVVAALLRKEEVLLDQHSQRDTPLTAAVNGGHLECAQMLLERGTGAGKALARIPQLPDDGKCAHGHGCRATTPSPWRARGATSTSLACTERCSASARVSSASAVSRSPSSARTCALQALYRLYIGITEGISSV